MHTSFPALPRSHVHELLVEDRSMLKRDRETVRRRLDYLRIVREAAGREAESTGNINLDDENWATVREYSGSVAVTEFTGAAIDALLENDRQRALRWFSRATGGDTFVARAMDMCAVVDSEGLERVRVQIMESRYNDCEIDDHETRILLQASRRVWKPLDKDRRCNLTPNEIAAIIAEEDYLYR